MKINKSNEIHGHSAPNDLSPPILISSCFKTCFYLVFFKMYEYVQSAFKNEGPILVACFITSATSFELKRLAAITQDTGWTRLSINKSQWMKSWILFLFLFSKWQQKRVEMKYTNKNRLLVGSSSGTYRSWQQRSMTKLHKNRRKKYFKGFPSHQ